MTISLKLPEALDARLTETARRRGLTRSALVREAIEAHIARDAPESFAAQATDLLGSIAAAPDLASNPRYLAGYGR